MRFEALCLSALLILAPSQPPAWAFAAELDENARSLVLPAGQTGDAPAFVKFEVSPRKLKRNRVNLITISFKFRDDGANLQGGSLIFNRLFSEHLGWDTYEYPLDHKKFKKTKAGYAISFALLVEVPSQLWSWKQVTIWSSLEDGKGNVGGESDHVTLKRAKKTPNVKEGNQVGGRAYDFTLLNHKGKKVKLSSFRGKIVLVNFSTMWCGPCRSEADHLRGLYQEYEDDGLVVLTVLVQDEAGRPITPLTCKAWAQTCSLAFPVLADTFHGLYEAYSGVRGMGDFPYNFIIDRNGILRWKKVGYTAQIAAEIDGEILELLGK